MPDLRMPAFVPDTLTQTINPWNWIANLTGISVGQVNVYLGETSNPELEKKILESVGTYGKQIGQIGDALAVLLRHVDLGKLDQDEQDAIDELKSQLAKVDRLKRRVGVKPALASI